MKRTKLSRWQMVLIIVCICFFIGVLIGAVSSNQMNSEQIEKLNTYIEKAKSSDMGFMGTFMKHAKYIAAIWLSGFIYSGAFIVLIIMFVLGLFYGFSSAFSILKMGMAHVLGCIFPHNIILIPLYIFAAVWSVEYVLKKFTNNGPKSRIKRERKKRLTEHLIILGACMAANAVVCVFEIYVSGNALWLIK